MKMLVTAMRQAARSVEVAECAVRWRDAGVVGFDVAGPEKGYPPTRYLDAFDHVRRENFHITIHAGESFGLPSIWEALQFCGAERLGHGVRIVDDITVRDDGSVELGRLAAFVRDRRVPLEMCPTSNVHTGAAASIADHPIDLLRRLRFRVTVNTDNRLMSGVSMSSEFAALDAAFGIGLGEMEWLTINAMKSAFAPFDERLRIINEVVKPGYARLRARGEPGRRLRLTARTPACCPARPGAGRAAVRRRCRSSSGHRVVARAEPLLALLRRPVRPALRVDPALELLLDPVVAHGRGGVERLVDVGLGERLEEAASRPHASPTRRRSSRPGARCAPTRSRALSAADPAGSCPRRSWMWWPYSCAIT